MNIDLSLIAENAIVIVPIIIALVQAFKMTGWIKDHFAPLVAIGLGIVVSLLVSTTTATWSTQILSGTIYGLISSGLYSGVKTTLYANARLKEERKQDSRNDDPF